MAWNSWTSNSPTMQRLVVIATCQLSAAPKLSTCLFSQADYCPLTEEARPARFPVLYSRTALVGTTRPTLGPMLDG